MSSPDSEINKRIRVDLVVGGDYKLGKSEEKAIESMTSDQLREGAIAHAEDIGRSADPITALRHAARAILLNQAAIRKEGRLKKK